MFIPVSEPLISKEAKENIIKAVNTGWISSSGKFIDKFEKKYAEKFKTKYAISVSSGTAALHVALLSLGVGKGDEVIVPAFSFPATVDYVTFMSIESSSSLKIRLDFIFSFYLLFMFGVIVYYTIRLLKILRGDISKN